MAEGEAGALGIMILSTNSVPNCGWEAISRKGNNQEEIER